MKKLIFLMMVLVMVVGCSDDETTTQPTGMEQGAAIGQAQMGAGMAADPGCACSGQRGN